MGALRLAVRLLRGILRPLRAAAAAREGGRMKKPYFFDHALDGTRVDYVSHHPNSRRFTCRCGELHIWTPPAPYEHKSRVRCALCHLLHVRETKRLRGKPHGR